MILSDKIGYNTYASMIGFHAEQSAVGWMYSGRITPEASVDAAVTIARGMNMLTCESKKSKGGL